ncbi:Os07g0517400 [Oryza sativa Japonica Group]|uniref:Os07g0517400 protein n=1 Tax=Oryza sativa subsp. japonica TaxID=39947 RepID=Q0D619_ORYSJ|nr:Os07g0517400 [Oryza sativa Japonica Group]|eukprot:NP_001059790.2 Os07g0517400 [Oryza sativa Japonica Group]
MSRREPAVSSPFRDLSNLRTPNPRAPPNPKSSASKEEPLPSATPTTRRRRGPPPPPRPGAATATPLARRLRALELDQSRSARRAESGRDGALRAFASSATSWLSLLLRDPSACGCAPSAAAARVTRDAPAHGVQGKRDAVDGERARGRSPKRHRGGEDRGGPGPRRKTMTPAMAASLRDSLREVCSLDDVTERMGSHMSREACEEVLVMMCQICKNIDNGRLKMKEHCPLVSDLRLRDKAIRIFMCYNPKWLRIGLHIVLGGDSWIQNESQKKDKEVAFLKFVLEKQLFVHMNTQPSALNKAPEGHRRACYAEAASNSILKRLFLLVAALDRAKIESGLPSESGIDGLDGGSPLLFCRQTEIKSSRQIVQESLGEVMHGEEYDFTVGNLFEDLQDGIILCRIIQLLTSDASIILKVIAPSDTYKKRLHNCTMAIQYIKQAGFPLSDADGLSISAEDIVNGDKELILALLWNMFIYMQLPVLVNETSVAQEISRLKAPVSEQSISEMKSQTGLLYDWIQVVCAKYGISVESSSQIDRRALNYFISYYLNINIPNFPLKETLSDCRKELFSCHKTDMIADITTYQFNNIGKVLAQFLQDLPGWNILANDVLFVEKSAIILLAFLSSHLTNVRRLEQLKNLIDSKLDHQSLVTEVSPRRRSRGTTDMKCHFPQTEETDGSRSTREWAATVIQTQARRLNAMSKYCKLKNATQPCNKGHDPASSSPLKSIADSSCIDSATKLVCEDDVDCSSNSCQVLFYHDPVSTKVDFLFCRKAMAARKIQFAYRRFAHRIRSRISAAIKIQSHWRCFSVRIRFKRQIQNITTIQAVARCVLCHRDFQKQRHAAIVIQRIFRGWLLVTGICPKVTKMVEKGPFKSVYQNISNLSSVLCSWLVDSKTSKANSMQRLSHSMYLQRWWRQVLFLESRKRSVIVIQAHVRGWIARQTAVRNKKRITIIQSYVKAYLLRKRSKQEITDDIMCLINRLIAAVSQRSISTIRQICATLSTATEHSEKCCQTIVNAGAVEILLKQINLLNRGVPDQEVLKQVLFTLRNIARFRNLQPVLANTPQAVEIVFQELLRSKTEGFFVACDILKRLCESEEGHKIARALKRHIRRLGCLVQELEKKVDLDKR